MFYSNLHFPVRVRLGKYSCSSIPEYVFRVASPDSSRINSRAGLRARLYADLNVDDIPSLDDIGTPGTQRAYSCKSRKKKRYATSIKYRRRPTGWISTTFSLLRALQILFIKHREQWQLSIIRTAACKDMFSAAELRDCLPGLQNNQYLEMKPRNGFLIRGKVEANSIVGRATVKSLQSRHLDIIVPSLGDLSDWRYKSRWEDEFILANLTHREVSIENSRCGSGACDYSRYE